MTKDQKNLWQFHNPTGVRFGPGCRAELLPLTQGKRLLIVTTRRGRAQFEADPLLHPLAAGDVTWHDGVTPNPGLAETQEAIDRLLGQSFDLVLAFGGGSAMDAAKALSAALAPGLATRDLARLIAEPAVHLDRPLLPLIAVTTTSGTGAEVTPFATIWDHAARKKLSLASPRLYPATAIVDPELTHDLPRDATLSTGLDALNQALESLWNRNRTPLSQAFAHRAVGLALQALPRLAADLADHEARAAMAEASLLAGMAISQTRTALCHSISYPLTAHFGLSHGWACAATMMAVLELAVTVEPDLLSALAQAVGAASPEALLRQIDALARDLGLSEVAAAHVPDVEAACALIPEMFTPGRSDNFIAPVTAGVIERILRASF